MCSWWWFIDGHTRSEFPLGNLLSFHELPCLQHSVPHHLLWGSWPACILLTFSCTWRNMSKWIALFCSFDTGFFDGEWTEGTGMLVRSSKEALRKLEECKLERPFCSHLDVLWDCPLLAKIACTIPRLTVQCLPLQIHNKIQLISYPGLRANIYLCLRWYSVIMYCSQTLTSGFAKIRHFYHP